MVLGLIIPSHAPPLAPATCLPSGGLSGVGTVAQSTIFKLVYRCKHHDRVETLGHLFLTTVSQVGQSYKYD